MTTKARSEEIKDGGPAFPVDVPVYMVPQDIPSEWREKIKVHVMKLNGLTKREWFAGIALYGAMLADIERAKNGYIPLSEKGESDLADTCYRISDAMLKESEKKV